ncbi:hypothetical protein [Acinetobacter sp. LUNF3]|uniref:hypothetical protein n=1 Tax=Acinetobacter sp. LUNF3 TaxID=2925837 RepID=UPI001F61E535|nr:hypothetical protein [Acinetobacter sp. LUNF3]UNT43324.1 hypothetical protein MN200_00425 [Acinetobacter sp. LUNF3]
MKYIYPILLISMIAFPKSGIAIGKIPLNSITILIISLFPILLLKYVVNIGKTKSSNLPEIYFLLILPFYFLLFIFNIFNGIENLSSYFGFIFSVIITPLFFLMLFRFISYQNIREYDNFFINCVRFVAIYGILLFIYKVLTGSFFEVPGLTTTYGAAIELEDRMNDRGGIFKLFSTFNNGNLYGLSILMLFPLYTFLEKNKLFVLIVSLSLILTFSRTIWVLLFLYLLYTAITNSKFNPIKIVFGVILVSLFILIINIVLSFLGFNLNFIFDSSLGGRSEAFSKISFDLYSSNAFDIISEIPYVSLIYSLGLISLPFFLLYFSNILINFKYIITSKNSFRKSATLGSVIYFLACLSDGAIIYIPVFIVFIFVTFLSLKNESKIS